MASIWDSAIEGWEITYGPPTGNYQDVHRVYTHADKRTFLDRIDAEGGWYRIREIKKGEREASRRAAYSGEDLRGRRRDKKRSPVRKPTRVKRRRTGRDPDRGIKKIVLRGRTYDVAVRERINRDTGEVTYTYVLTGKRGAQFATIRNEHHPDRMFIVPYRGFNPELKGVWLSDDGGYLKVLRS